MKQLKRIVLAIALSVPLVTAGIDHAASAVDAAANKGESGQDKAAAIPKVDLKLLGSIHLGAGSAKLPTEGIGDFDIDDRGRFGFLSWDECQCDNQAFVLLDSDGKQVRTIALKGLPGISLDFPHRHALTWISGDRWLLTDSGDGYGLDLGPTTAALWIDAAKGTITRIARFDSAPIYRLVGTRDGGFIAMTAPEIPRLLRPFVPQAITAFDARGAKRWTIINEKPKTSTDALGFLGGVAVTTSRIVVVLEDSAQKLAEYGLDGKLLRTVALAHLPNGRIASNARIQADATGGIVVAATGMPPARFALDGTLLGTLSPTYPGGRRFHPYEVHATPDGRLWTSDRDALLGLDKTGLVDLFIGQPFVDPDHLGTISGGIAVSPSGWIYAIDQVTLSVHVFDDSGKHVRVDRPDPKDINAQMFWLSASDSGEVFQGRGTSGDAFHDFLHYRSNGERTGFESVALKDDAAEGMFAQPGSPNRWVLGKRSVTLADAKGKILRTLDQTKQGQRFAVVLQGVAVAPDGSIAVPVGIEERVPGVVKPRHVSVVTHFSKSGDPIATWPIPDGMTGHYGTIAFDATRFAFLQRAAESGDAQTTSVIVTDVQGKPQFRFMPTAIADWRSRPLMVFLVKRGGARELWLSDVHGNIDRYAMP